MSRFVIGTAIGLIVFGVFQVHVAWPEQSPSPAAGSNWMEDLLPTVDPGHLGTWIFERNGSWGATDNRANVWIDPGMPRSKRYSVLIHEQGHVLQVQQYGSLDAARAEKDIESDADCYALDHGADWINYGCDR